MGLFKTSKEREEFFSQRAELIRQITALQNKNEQLLEERDKLTVERDISRTAECALKDKLERVEKKLNHYKVMFESVEFAINRFHKMMKQDTVSSFEKDLDKVIDDDYEDPMKIVFSNDDPLQENREE